MDEQEEQLFKKLEAVQAAYEATLALSTLASSTRNRMFPPEPVRNIAYPLDLALSPTMTE